jgi:hypothetical protein
MVRFTWRRDINKKAKILVSAPCPMFWSVVPTGDYAEKSEIPE